MGELCHQTSQVDFNRWTNRSFDGDGSSHDFVCWNLVREVLKETKGIDLPSFEKGSPAEYENKQMIHDQHSLYGFMEVKLEEAQPLDVMVFRSAPKRAHVGLVVSRGKFLHAGRGYDSCIERYTGIQWRNRIEGVYRYIG